MKYWKKLLSLVLALCMVASMVVLPVSATEETDATEPEATEPEATEPEATEPETCTQCGLGTFNGKDAYVDAEGKLHICVNNFPDAAFRDYIAQYGGDGNMDGITDGWLTPAESDCVETIACEGRGISSVEGLQHFAMLRELRCHNNPLTQLDVSMLDNLAILWCNFEEGHDRQGTLVLNSTSGSLVELECSNFGLTELDLTGQTALQILRFNNNHGIQVTGLDSTNLPNLTCLDYGNCGLILDPTVLSGFTGLTELFCYANGMTELDVSGMTDLVSLNCGENQLAELDISALTKLDYLYCCHNALSALYLNANAALVHLYCSGNQLTELDVSAQTGLRNLACAGNILTDLDLSANTGLELLDCIGNQLTELDLSGLSQLTVLHCGENALGYLDLSANTKLETLEMGNQYIPGPVAYENDADVYLVQMGNYVGQENLDKVVPPVDGADSYDSATGYATFSSEPTGFTYCCAVPANENFPSAFMIVYVGDVATGDEGGDEGGDSGEYTEIAGTAGTPVLEDIPYLNQEDIFRGMIEEAGQKVWFKIDVTDSGLYQFAAADNLEDPESGAEVVITLYDAQMNMQFAVSGIMPEHNTVLTGGETVVVSVSYVDPDMTGDLFFAYALMEAMDFSSVEELPALELGVSTDAVVNESGDQVWFRFTAPAAGTYMFRSAAFESVDTWGALYSAELSRLADNDDNGTFMNFMIIHYLEEGETVALSAKFLGDDIGSFPVIVEESPVVSMTFDTELAIIENTFGNYTTENGIDFYYRYDWAQQLGYTVTLQDGTIVTGKGPEYNYPVAGTDGYRFGIMGWGDDQGFENTWTVGEDPYICGIEYMNQSQEVAIYIEAAPQVDSLILEDVYVPMEDHRWEHTINNQGLELEYRHINWENYLRGQITINGISYDVQNGWFEYEGVSYQLWYRDDQPNSTWDVGGSFICSAGIMNMAADVTVHVTEGGESGDDSASIPALEEMEALVLDMPVSCDVPGAGQLAWLSFTPDQDGAYMFRSVENYEFDTWGELYVWNAEAGTYERLDYNDDYGTYMNFMIARKLTAGTTYVLGVRYNNPEEAGNITVVVEHSPVVDATFADAAQVYEASLGNYREENGTSFYYYENWQDELNYTVTLADGSTASGSGGWYYYRLDETDGESNLDFRFESLDAGQSAENPWTVGNSYGTQVQFLGQVYDVTVSIIPGPADISLQLQPIHVGENNLGNMYDDGNGETYFHYYWDSYVFGTITLDGEEYRVEYNGFEYNGKRYNLWYTDTQAETHWVPGNTYTVTVGIMGAEATLNVQVIGPDGGTEGTGSLPFAENMKVLEPGENAIASIPVSDASDWFTFTPTESGTYCFFAETPGSDTWGALYDADMNLLVSDDDSYGDGRFLITYDLEAGKTYIFRARFLVCEMSGNFYVHLEQKVNPIQSISVSAVTIPENANLGMLSDGENTWLAYSWFDMTEFTITFTDGSTYSGSGRWFEYEGMGYELSWADDQKDNPWTEGTYTGTLYYEDISVEVPVTITECPIQSIVWEDVTVYEGMDCWGQEMDGQTYTYYEWQSKITTTVTFKDGQVNTGTAAGGFDYNGYVYRFFVDESQNYQHENPFVVGQSYTYPVQLGSFTDTITVTLEPYPITGITVSDVELEEGTCGGNHGMYDEEGNYREYWHYYWGNSLKGTVSFTDGTSSDFNGTSIYYNDRWFNLSTSDDQGFDNPWTKGNTYTGTVSIGNSSTNVNVTVTGHPITSLVVEPMTLAAEDYAYGYYDTDANGDSYFRYSWWNNMKWTATFNDGAVVTGTGTYINNPNTGRNYSIEWMDDQYNVHWVAGNTYEATATVGEQTCTVYVTIAQKQEENGYVYLVQNGGAIITNCYREDQVLTIPDTLGGYPVIGITGLSYATEYFQELIIPDSVTMLGYDLLCWAMNMQKLTIGAGVTDLNRGMLHCFTQRLEEITVSANNANYCTVDGVLYDKAQTTMIYYPPAKLSMHTVPNTVTDIEALFDGRCTPVNVTLGTGNTGYVQSDGVIYTADMTKVMLCNQEKTGAYTMPNTVTRIAYHAFLQSSLSEVTISDNVTDIVYHAFYGSTNLTKVTMSDAVTTIGFHAFSGCYNLTQLNPDANSDTNLPASLQTLTWGAFKDASLQGSIEIPGAVTEIGGYAFCGNALTSITLNEGTTYIGSSAFYGTQISSIALPASVYDMGSRVFANCRNLTQVTLNNQLGFIPYECFSNTGLTSITIPEAVNSIEAYAFSNCTALTSVTFQGIHLSYIGEHAFQNTGLTGIDLPDYTGYIADWAFSGTALTDVYIPLSVPQITYRSFAHCTQLLNIDVPPTLNSLDGYAFDDTAWFSAQPDGPVYLESYLYGFKGEMPANYHLEIREGTTLVAECAFQGMQNLTGVTLPDSMCVFTASAFRACVNLTDIDTTATSNFTFDGSILYDINGNAVWGVVTGVDFLPEGMWEWYSFGESLVLNGASWNVTHADGWGNWFRASEDQAQGYDPLTPGYQDVVFSWGGYSETVTVYVDNPDHVDSIQITTLPTKLTYSLNQQLRTDGMVVMAELNGASFDVTQLCGVSAVDTSAAGTQTVTVEYMGCLDTFDITVDGASTNITADPVTDTVVDPDTGDEIEVEYKVEVDLDTSVAESVDPVLQVEKIQLEEELEDTAELPEIVLTSTNNVVFDIKLVDANTGENITTEEDKPITVSILVPQYMDGNNCKVLYIKDDGTYEELQAYFDGTYMIFQVNHFSFYGLVEGAPEEQMELVDGLNSVQIAAGTDYYAYWTAEQAGEFTVTMECADWYYKVNVGTIDAETGAFVATTDNGAHKSNEYPYVNSQTVTVQAGDVVRIDFDTVSGNAGTLNLRTAFTPYAAMIGETGYASVSAALAAAQSGETVTLMADASESYVIIPTGVTLDLASNTLTADYVIGVKGSYLTGTTFKTDGTPCAKLVVDQNKVVLSNEAFYDASVGYYVLPVWDNENNCYVVGRYVINETGGSRGFTVNEAEDKLVLTFKHKGSGTVNTTFLADGTSDNAVTFLVRITWTAADGDQIAQDYKYGDAMVEKAAGDWDFKITFTGYQACTDITVTAMLVSNTGVEVAGVVHSVN